MNVLSLFDGISCGRVALERAGIMVDKYFASEIKKTAIAISQLNHKDIIQIGDVTKVFYENGILITEFGVYKVKIDLLIGGSPCKGISRLNKKQDGLDHKESKLFWEYDRIYRAIKTCNKDMLFLLENTHGNKQATNTITEQLNVNKLSINSKLVSAQNRPRYYWTNIENIKLPKNKGITTKDVFQDNFAYMRAPDNRVKWLTNESGIKSIKKGYTRINPFPKSGCITANGHKKWNCNYIKENGYYRFLAQEELEALQTLPKGYCNGLSYGDAYDVIGDAWTVDVIAHILSHIK